MASLWVHALCFHGDEGNNFSILLAIVYHRIQINFDVIEHILLYSYSYYIGS